MLSQESADQAASGRRATVVSLLPSATAPGSALALTAVRRKLRLEHLLLKRRLALLEALGAAPWEGLVQDRGLWPALLAEAGGCIVVDASLAERARAQLALSRLACGAHSTVLALHAPSWTRAPQA